MRCLIGLLGILLLDSATRGDVTPYRFQALIDRDRSSATGCDAVTPAGVLHGSEVRVSAETDRATRQRVTSEVCVAGAWQTLAVDNTPQPIGLGLGHLASDRIEWPLPRSLLSGSDNSELRLFGENRESGAYDVLGRDGAFVPIDIRLGGSVEAVPAFSTWAVLLLAVTLMLATHRRLRASRSTMMVLALAALCGVLAPTGTQAEMGVERALRVDRANDSVGHDAGVDLLEAAIADDADGLHLRIEVNNIEADGLPDDARVLFIGNSLTYTNDLPGMLRAIAAQAGKRLITGEVSAPNFSLEDHYAEGDAQVEIARGYQIVVLQQGPSALQASQINLEQWALKFNTLIRRAGGQPALYMVWPERARLDVFDDVRNSYSNAALVTDGLFLPAGEAWRASWAMDPGLALYGEDDFHPSPLGTYAAALAIFSELYRQTPLDLPASLAVGPGAAFEWEPGAARVVQQGAWQAHLQYGRTGHGAAD
ncbi:MAG: hypothetical protein ABI411_02830 [Tahibacter sp.]